MHLRQTPCDNIAAGQEWCIELGYGALSQSNKGNVRDQRIWSRKADGTWLNIRQDYSYDGYSRLWTFSESVLAGGSGVRGARPTAMTDGGIAGRHRTCRSTLMVPTQQSQIDSMTNRVMATASGTIQYTASGEMKSHQSLLRTAPPTRPRLQFIQGRVPLPHMKKLINDPQDVVRESLEGFATAHADLVRVCYEPLYVVRRDAPVAGKVGVVSGGGSGHEPMHAGYVGKGMLDAAVPGQVFTSPTPDQIEAATRAVDGGAGVLHIVKNYTGDILNFEMAAELCQAEGGEVQAVVIDDDVAVENSLYTAWRRGVGATVIAEKICGAAAERGYDLDRVAGLCRKVKDNGRSMGMALTSCTVPAAGKPTFELGASEMEMGIGIHGEPGRERLPVETARQIVERMADAILSDLQPASGDSVIAMVNGLGGTPLIELYILYHELAKILDTRGVSIGRRLVGNYMTSLEMAGCSITLLRADEELLSLWDDPVLTPALRWGL